jgi:hypothetical protein
VTGDRYAGEWPREQFAKHGIAYMPSERTKSDIYRDVLPLLTSGRVELLDDARLIGQLGGLERRTARGGRDSIDHAPGGHDDVANSASGAIVVAVAVEGVSAASLHWAGLDVNAADFDDELDDRGSYWSGPNPGGGRSARRPPRWEPPPDGGSFH